MAAISNSKSLYPKTFVTLPSEVPPGSSATAIESLLEIDPGKGAYSITFKTSPSNLAVPANGPLTSGNAVQFQLKQSVPINPGDFVKTP